MDSRPAKYPRAWACFTVLAEAFTNRGRHPLRLPAAPIPELPHGDEVVTVPLSGVDDAGPVFSAIDPRYDQHMIAALRDAATAPTTAWMSALSRYSRNSDKLHRTVEYLLAHQTTILTTNYLIRPTDVWIRRGHLRRLDSRDPYTALTDIHGLAGTHRNIVEDLTRRLSGIDRAPITAG
ncbi:hypothetical protein [Actinoplanes derwentensis]|uniref:Uncharacterized protein n=1 Tax=Actinoplanes derwentensis TaxID=113562 RepID=A0A1H1XNX0_9ACTN|nr:hypothetical protein [Actinoplanes derwentensis]GID87702.1 hypothetical protein Ade03nite_66260 [Actinoplanes derwentensis]SDT10967.1 hypothetical protein SAMN04489716_2534 [Actinoplanes derwentensis]